MSCTFITGTGTGVGKTLVTCALGFQLKGLGRAVQLLKPVISGTEGQAMKDMDSGYLLQAMNRDITDRNIAAISPWRFAAPLSPDMAARREGRAIDFDRLIDYCEDACRGADVTLIEGIGGAFVPLSETHRVADWIAALKAPAIVVTGNYLGALSHAQATLIALEREQIPVAGLVVSESGDNAAPLDETIETLSRFIGPVPILALPRLAAGLKLWQRAPDLTGLIRSAGL